MPGRHWETLKEISGAWEGGNMGKHKWGARRKHLDGSWTRHGPEVTRLMVASVDVDDMENWCDDIHLVSGASTFTPFVRQIEVWLQSKTDRNQPIEHHNTSKDILASLIPLWKLIGDTIIPSKARTSKSTRIKPLIHFLTIYFPLPILVKDPLLIWSRNEACDGLHQVDCIPWEHEVVLQLCQVLGGWSLVGHPLTGPMVTWNYRILPFGWKKHEQYIWHWSWNIWNDHFIVEMMWSDQTTIMQQQHETYCFYWFFSCHLGNKLPTMISSHRCVNQVGIPLRIWDVE